MIQHAPADSPELTFLRNRVAELEAKARDLGRDYDNERLLKISQRLTKSGGWLWNVGKKTMTWTEETYRIHDLDREQLVPGSPELITLSKACISPEDRPKIATAFQRCVELGEPYDLELSFTTHKGRKLWIRTTAEATWEEGQITRVTGNILDITERKQTEEHLKIYQNIVSSAPNGIAFVNPQYRYVIVNDAYERFSGIGKEKFIGRTVAEYLGEDVFEKSIKPHFDKCLQGECVNFQEWFDYPTLGRRFVEVTYFPYRNLLNQVAGIVANTRDITNRRKTADLLAARLRLSEASVTLGLNDLLTLALDEAEALTDSHIGFFHFFDDDQKTITLQAWSTATRETFCQAEGFGLHYNLQAAGVWADCIRERRAIIHNNYAGLSHRRGMPDGHAPVVRELVVPVFRNELIVAIFAIGNKALEYNDKDIELVANLGDLVWDIVLRKRAEEFRKESEEQFQTLASLAPVGIYITSPGGQCHYANPRWCEMAGLTQAQALGEGWIAGLHPDDRAMVYSNWQQMVESEGHWGFEYRFQTPAGKTTWVFGLAAPQRDDTGTILQYIGVNTDITTQKQTEERLTVALQEKDVLLREVHHRVKNNMAAIIGLFNLQRQNIAEPQVQTILGELSSRVKAMSLVHEKLYHSDSLARIDFQEYLQSLILHLQTSFSAPGIRFQINAFGVEVPLDLAVPCGMIVNELITNAIKYAFPRERPATTGRDDRILITMARDKDTLSLSVADNGVGLPPGFDFDTSKTIGLALVRMLGRHQLGGQYTIDRNGGTRFTLAFSLGKLEKTL